MRRRVVVRRAYPQRYGPQMQASAFGRRPHLSAFPRVGRSGGGGRLLIGLVMMGFALFSYFASSEYNPVTGENQYIGLTTHQEIALGLQAAPDMIQRHGGLHPDAQAQAVVDRLGDELVRASVASQTDWQFDFHLLADRETINAFALPGGQVFITWALYSRFETEGQLAGVLGHEIGHVVARHSAQRIAKSRLTQGLTGAVAVASESAGSAQIAAVLGQLLNMRYGREDELQSDELGAQVMADAGYDPRSMVAVMGILAEASGGARGPEFFSTHPNPENRIGRIEATISERFPAGLPDDLRR